MGCVFHLSKLFSREVILIELVVEQMERYVLYNEMIYLSFPLHNLT